MSNIMNNIIEELELNSRPILDIDWHNWYQTYLDNSKYNSIDLDSTIYYFMKNNNFSKCYIKYIDNFNIGLVFTNIITDDEFTKFNGSLDAKNQYVLYLLSMTKVDKF